MSELKIGMVGLDTSHCPAFVKLLNDPTNEFHVPGCRIVKAFPGGSAKFSLSANRVEGFTNELKEAGIEIVDSIVTDNNEYYALIPVETPENLDSDTGELVILKVVEENGEEFLDEIEDDEEYESISEAFMDRLEDIYDFES